MKLEGIKNFKDDGKTLSFTMCKTCKTCPDLIISKDSDEVILGGEHEGISTWTKDQFKDFVHAIKLGVADEYLTDDNQNPKGQES